LKEEKGYNPNPLLTRPGQGPILRERKMHVIKEQGNEIGRCISLEELGKMDKFGFGEEF
jgi:hypothetical protein